MCVTLIPPRQAARSQRRGTGQQNTAGCVLPFPSATATCSIPARRGNVYTQHLDLSTFGCISPVPLSRTCQRGRPRLGSRQGGGFLLRLRRAWWFLHFFIIHMRLKHPHAARWRPRLRRTSRLRQARAEGLTNQNAEMPTSGLMSSSSSGCFNLLCANNCAENGTRIISAGSLTSEVSGGICSLQLLHWAEIERVP